MSWLVADPAGTWPRRQVWIRRWRLHHGEACCYVLAFALLGIAHDWKDKGEWFAFLRSP